MMVACRDTCDTELNTRIELGDEYFHDLRERWSKALRAAHAAIPAPPYIAQQKEGHKVRLVEPAHPTEDAPQKR
jgi:predicted proteasome-type protease